MGLFFTQQQDFKESTKHSARQEQNVEMLHQLECDACPLNCQPVQTPNMDPSGSDEPLVYFLGEGPGQQEDELGRPFVGTSGQFIKRRVPGHYKNEVRYNNCVRTKPPGNRNPTWKELRCCEPSVIRDIEQTKPVVIVPLGAVALDWLLPGEKGILSWRGKWARVRVGSHECWVVPTWHPAAVLYEAREHDKEPLQTTKGEAFALDLKSVFRHIETLPWPEVDDLGAVLAQSDGYGQLGIETIDGSGGESDLKLLEQRLAEYGDADIAAFDLETSGLKQYGKDARILTNSVTGPDGTIAYALNHRETKWTRKQLKRAHELTEWFFRETRARKAAHNAPFDLKWLVAIYGRHIARGSEWDCTKAQAYTLDERKGTLSLETLCQIHFGVPLKKFTDLDRGKLDRYPLDKVLPYNALDTYYTERLCQVQLNILEDRGQLDFYEDNQARRLPSLVLSMDKGILIDRDEAKRNQKRAQDMADKAMSAIKEEESVQALETKQRREFNPDSPPQVQAIFRDYLGREEGWQDSGKYSTKEEVLKQIEHPLASRILEYRGATKMKGTFIDPLVHGDHVSNDGRVHTNYDPAHTFTGRLASSAPAMQNQPTRTYPWVRSHFIADPGCLLAGIDLAQIEARVIAMASSDPTLCEALATFYDVHMDWATRLAYAYPRRIGGKKFIKDKDVMKKFRGDVKNGWTFPLFYGASAFSASGYMNIPIEKIEPLYDDFWQEFHGVGKWQEELQKQYKKQGYVESLTGRRRHAPMTLNELINTPVQGDASDICINAKDRLSEHAQETEDWCFQPNLNIHDDLTFNLPEDRLDEYLEPIVETMIFPEFDWISVPIGAEVKVGADLYSMEEIGEFFSHQW